MRDSVSAAPGGALSSHLHVCSCVTCKIIQSDSRARKAVYSDNKASSAEVRPKTKK